MRLGLGKGGEGVQGALEGSCSDAVAVLQAIYNFASRGVLGYPA